MDGWMDGRNCHYTPVGSYEMQRNMLVVGWIKTTMVILIIMHLV
jgi:hypothetical protein